MVLSDGGGWNGEAAAGCPAVVVVGAVGAAGGVGVGVGAAGGGRVAVRAGAAGAVRRAGRGFGASTVTCGTVTVGAAPAGGVSGAGSAGCGAGVSAAGGVCGVVVAGGVSGGVAGVCDDAMPAKQSSTSAELLSRSKRLLWIDITSPHPGRERPRQPRQSTHHGETAPRGIPALPSLARSRGRYQIDVRRWEVRALETARRVMPSNQIRRPRRAATGRNRSAAAKAASRPAPTRRRDGSVCRSGSSRPRGLHDLLDWKAH
jgi:hypothetical protein